MKKEFQKLRIIKIVLGVGILFFVWRLRQMIISPPTDISDFTFSIIFNLWIFLPYALFYLFKKNFTKNKLSLIISSIFLVGLDIYTHAEVFLWPSSSTSALIFLISPIYLIGFMFIGKFIGDLISWASKKTK